MKESWARRSLVPRVSISAVTHRRERYGARVTLMELFWWFFTIVLFAIGLLGTVLPFVPGTTVILAAAIIHRLMLGSEKSISWTTIIILILLTLLSYGLDFLGGYWGAKYFGATRWGTFGAVLGA